MFPPLLGKRPVSAGYVPSAQAETTEVRGALMAERRRLPVQTPTQSAYANRRQGSNPGV